MSSQPDFTVKIEQMHECGQVHEQIMHLFADDLLSFTFSHKVTMPPLAPAEPLVPGPLILPDVERPVVSLTGHTDRFEWNGVELRDLAFVCVKCGADVLFGDPAKEQVE